jgi:hypothetical protein
VEKITQFRLSDFSRGFADLGRLAEVIALAELAVQQLADHREARAGSGFSVLAFRMMTASADDFRGI